MDPVVEAALISTVATLVSVGGTVAVAIVGFRISRSTNQATIDAARATADKTIEAARDTNKATIDAAHADVSDTLEATREGQITERFTRAIDQLGHARLEVRIGGIYALERIGKNSAADRPTVVYVMGALIRTRSRSDRAPGEEPPEDVYAALRVISRLAPATDVVVNLGGANLRNANLRFMHDTKVNIKGADLTGANVPESWPVDASPPPSRRELFNLRVRRRGATSVAAGERASAGYCRRRFGR